MKIEKTYIAEDGKRFDNLYDCENYEKKLEKQREEELFRKTKRLSDEFLLSVGFDVNKYNTESEKNRALNITWLIFDKYGNIKGLKTIGEDSCDFRYVSGDDKNDTTIMENWLRKNKLYGHALSSFADRMYGDFYERDLLGKLENLSWDVKNGKLVKTEW